MMSTDPRLFQLGILSTSFSKPLPDGEEIPMQPSLMDVGLKPLDPVIDAK
jgi:hypothetical protein